MNLTSLRDEMTPFQTLNLPLDIAGSLRSSCHNHYHPQLKTSPEGLLDVANCVYSIVH